MDLLKGIVAILIGLVILRISWHKQLVVYALIVTDTKRIIAQNPHADLDSDADFVKHQDRYRGWLLIVISSLCIIMYGGGLVLASIL
ncbi:hypothetical protein IPM44_03460 [bacterium]|nr:MAG: hypothetical protein IPM44_03460 [bacterium]